MELHIAGVDGGYSQKDVQEVARCFTVGSIRKPKRGGCSSEQLNAHDNGEKIVLCKDPAGGSQTANGCWILWQGARLLQNLYRDKKWREAFLATRSSRDGRR